MLKNYDIILPEMNIDPSTKDFEGKTIAMYYA